MDGDRDIAVDALRDAGLSSGAKRVWASQDRTIADRAARNYCFGLKRLLRTEWEVPYNIAITDEAPYIFTVGGEHALTVTVSNDTVEHQWQGVSWAS